MKSPYQRSSAFTLIELLVVIVIIAILASIALPVFNSVQERGRATTCASNLRQLGLGIQTYLNDNEDQMFPRGGGGGGADLISWPLTLHSRYVTNWKVYRSPFDKVTPSRPDVDREPGVPVSYGINDNLFGVNGAKFVSPSELIMAAPAMDPAPEPMFSQTSETNPPLPLPAGGAQKLGTHSNRGQINVLFADAHVQSMPYREFAEFQSENGLRRWYPEGKPAESSDE